MTENHNDEEAKTYNPNAWGIATGAIALVIFAITHFMFGFPDMLIHVFMLPFIIGLLVRWQIKRTYTNPYRDD